MSPQNVQKIEKGITKQISLDTLLRVLQGLGLEGDIEERVRQAILTQVSVFAQ